MDLQQHIASIETSTKSPKRFCLVFGVLMLLGLVGVWGINYFVDPYGAREGSLLPPIELSSRHMKMRLLMEAPKDTRVLVLGSSRQLRVLPEIVGELTGKRVFNAAVTGGGVQDAFALTRYAREAAGLPIDEIIFGLDIERLSPRNALQGDLVDNPELLEYIDAEFTAKERQHPPFDELTTTRLHYSLKAIYTEYKGTWPREDYRYQPDGSRDNLRAEREKAAGTFKLADYMPHSLWRYKDIARDYDQLGAMHLKALEAFFDYCDANKIRVTIFLSPSHPDVLKMFREETHFFARLAEVQEILATAARKRGYRYADATSITAFGGDPEAYYDGTHAFDSNSTKLMQWLLKMPYPSAQKESH